MNKTYIREIHDIINALNEEKNNLKNIFGEVKGLKQYNKIFLKDSLLTEEGAAKSIYQVIRYTLSFGAEGEDVTSILAKKYIEDDIGLRKQQKIINETQYAILRLLPNASKDFACKVVQNYRKQLFELDSSLKQIKPQLLTVVEQAKIIQEDIPATEKIIQTTKESNGLLKIKNKIKSLISINSVLNEIKDNVSNKLVI